MKRLQVTEHIKQLMLANLGDLPAEAEIAVFEAIVADSAPFQKKGTVWENAVAMDGFLAELASGVKLNSTVRLRGMHDSDPLPIGRVFHAEKLGNQVRAFFYTTDAKLASNIDNSVVDSVSIGAVPRTMNCSACGWDYKGADATIMNIIDRTCGNGHMIGVDGVHLKLNGVESWFELSAVDTGALKNAKIQSRQKAVMSQETRTRLAANGRDPEPYILFANINGDKGMDPTQFVAKLTEQATEIATLKASVATIEPLKVDLTAAQSKVTALEAQVADLTPKAAANAATVVFLKEQVRRALVATGKPTDNIPEDVAALIPMLQAAQTNLVNLLPAGGVSQPADASKDKGAGSAPPSAFTNRKLA